MLSENVMVERQNCLTLRREEVGAGRGWHHMWFFSRLPTATQCQNLRIHIILLTVKYFFFNLVPSRLFHSFWAEPIIRWVKTGDPREKPPDHPQAELGLPHLWPELGSNTQRWDDERFRSLKVSGLNHSARGAAGWQIAIFSFSFFVKVGVGRGWHSNSRKPQSKKFNIIRFSGPFTCIPFQYPEKNRNGKKLSQEPVCGGALGRRWGGGAGGALQLKVDDNRFLFSGFRVFRI